VLTNSYFPADDSSIEQEDAVAIQAGKTSAQLFGNAEVVVAATKG
jgi:hypothetical protein